MNLDSGKLQTKHRVDMDREELDKVGSDAIEEFNKIMMAPDMMDKVIVDGKVAVLISQGYGAGWSTGVKGGDVLLFDPVIVGILLNWNYNIEEIEKYMDEKYPDFYYGVLDDLTIKWVPQGARFHVEEYDGSETLVLESEMKWHTA